MGTPVRLKLSRLKLVLRSGFARPRPTPWSHGRGLYLTRYGTTAPGSAQAQFNLPQGFVDFYFRRSPGRSRKLTPSLYRRLHGLSGLAMFIRTTKSTSFCAVRPVRAKPPRAHRRLPLLLTSAGGFPAPLRSIFMTARQFAPSRPMGGSSHGSCPRRYFRGVYCLMRPGTRRGRPPARAVAHLRKKSQGRTK
jgi:hypothetical protein